MTDRSQTVLLVLFFFVGPCSCSLRRFLMFLFSSCLLTYCCVDGSCLVIISIGKQQLIALVLNGLQTVCCTSLFHW